MRQILYYVELLYLYGKLLWLMLQYAFWAAVVGAGRFFWNHNPFERTLRHDE